MLRLVVLYQLIASLLVGPLLCCCATARLGQAASGHAATKSNAAGETPRKSCCGQPRTPPADAPDGGRSPCPCQGLTRSALTVPEAASTSADISQRLDETVSAFAPREFGNASREPSPVSAAFGSRTSSPSTSELLFAHHNLRC